MTKRINDYLFGHDLRSIGQADQLIPAVKTQSNFDALFEYLHLENRLLVMKAADAAEKTSKKRHEYLSSRKMVIIIFF